MDRGMGKNVERVTASDPPLKQALPPQEFEGVVRGGKIELPSGSLPDGTRVQVRVKK
jgi:hypothetical protein